MAQVAITPPAEAFEQLYERIRALPEGVTGEILKPGVLRTMSRPGRAHRHAARLCLHNLNRYDPRLGGSGWWIEVEAEIRLPGGHLAVPDLCGFRVERVPQIPDDNPLSVIPDFCCEILSPSTARDDVAIKLPLYARSGVRWIWLVNPAQHLVEVFETVGGRPAQTAIATDDQTIVLPPFDGEIDVGRYWLPATPEAAQE